MISVFSCSTSTSSNDSETDSDVIGTVDEDLQDSEIVDDYDELRDADSDTSENAECLDLRYNENTIKTPFPFKDANGKPTFCQGNKVSYQEFFTISGGTVDVIGCFYRFDKKKTYCPVDKTTSTLPDSIMGYNVFWGKWHLWKEIAAPDAIMRDWECYCNETGVCPLEE